MTQSELLHPAITMSSREIAQLCGKKHRHVLRDIERMLNYLNIDQEGYAQYWANPQNKQTYRQYCLPKDLTLTLVSGYKADLRYKIIKRWQALENQNPPSAALAALQAELLKARPRWALIRRYKALGLNHVEIARLLERSPETVRRNVRRMEACALLPAGTREHAAAQLPLLGGRHD